MRDPDLVVRAQQAATALESAWRRWRAMHGLATDPPPAVSSYVGYSLEAPWGEGRVVLGICAEEAERLAELLERHDCVGPVHAAVTAGSAVRSPGSGLAGSGLPVAKTQPEAAGFVHVPAPAPASGGQQPLSAESAFSRLDPLAGRPYRDPAAVSPLTGPAVPHSADAATPIARAASRAVEESMASRKKAVSGLTAARPGHASRAAATASDHALDGDDHPDPGSPPAGWPVTAAPPEASGRADRASSAGRAGRPADAAGLGDPGERADAAAETAVGGIPAISATQPFSWAADLLQGPGARPSPGERSGQRNGDGGGEPAAASPEIVAFRPRPEPVSPSEARQQDQGPGYSEGATAEHPGSDPSRVNRVTRGPSWSTFIRHGAATDWSVPPASSSSADLAAAPAAAPASAPDRAAAPSAGIPGTDPGPAGAQGQVEAPGWQQAGRDRISAAASSADAAAWGASELPGQAAVTDTAV